MRVCGVDAIQFQTERAGLWGEGERKRNKGREGLGERLRLSMSIEQKKDSGYADL